MGRKNGEKTITEREKEQASGACVYVCTTAQYTLETPSKYPIVMLHTNQLGKKGAHTNIPNREQVANGIDTKAEKNTKMN